MQRGSFRKTYKKRGNPEKLKEACSKKTPDDLLRLIMQLITLGEAVTTWLPAKAQHSPNVLRQLGNGIRGQLMQLHPVLEQNLGENWVWRHSWRCHKKLLEDNGLVIVWLRDSLLPWLTRQTFDKIS
jgi:hypothetical protein